MTSRRHVNPYIAGSPVTGTEMFFGRGDVFSFIRRNLIGRHQDNPIVLYGQRRTGKTSVLYQLHRHLDPNYRCIFIDLHGLSLDGMGNLLLGVANSISRGLERDHQLSVRVPARAFFLADPRAAFETTFLEELWPVLGEDHLVLMMDEVVRLQEEIKAGRLEDEIFEYLRHLMQHHTRLNFIFSLGSGLEEMEKRYAFLFNVSLYHRISFLETVAATELITDPARDCYQVTPEAVKKILQITSRHPYYTQLVCHCMFDRWIRSRKPTMTVEDVDMVLTEAIELGSANLTHVWEESTPEEQALMAGMAAAMRTVTGPATVKQIREAWRDVGVSLPERNIAKAIRSLTNREVITGDQTYSFTVDLQRLWLDKHRRLDWVKEELTQALRDWDQLRTPRLARRRTATTLAAALVVALAAGVAWQLAKPASHPTPQPSQPATQPTQTAPQLTQTKHCRVTAGYFKANTHTLANPTRTGIHLDRCIKPALAAHATFALDGWTSYNGPLNANGKPAVDRRVNRKLSTARVQAIANILVNYLGVPRSAITHMTGHGNVNQPYPADPSSPKNRVVIITYTVK